ncbi:MAG: MFS transporter [Methylotenera sp.]|nr:MFS transporter [Methylotenera sp.]
MIAQQLAGALGRRGVHYGWVVAAVTFLAMLTTSAALGLPGAMLQPLSREFGWSTDQLASVFAVRFALFGLLGPFAALFIARFGLSRIMVVAASFIALALGLATQVTQLWQLFVLWGLVLGCGTGLTALVLGAMVANRWFTQHRGLVVGLFAASAATGQLIFLPAAAWIIEHLGWRYAVLPVMAACIGVAVMALLFVRNQPRDVGLRPVGEPADAPLEAPLVAAPLDFRAPFKVLAMMGAFDLVGTTLSGYLSDRFDNRKLLFWYYALRGLSLFWLPYSTFTLYGLSLFAMFYGLDWIATVPPTVKLAAQAFGKEKAGLVFGWVFAAHQLGAAAAAYGAGLTRTLLLTYNPALFAAGAACLVAAVLVMRIRRAAPAAA